MSGPSASCPLLCGQRPKPPLPTAFLCHPTHWQTAAPLPVSHADSAAEARLLEDVLRSKAVRTVLQPIVSLRDGSVFGYEALSRGPAGSGFRKNWKQKRPVRFTGRRLRLIVRKITRKASKKFSKELKEARC